MKLMNFKKADGGITAIIVIIIVLVFIGWLVNIGGRECRTNKDCGKEAYCGSDFACHQIPVIERNVGQTSYTVPALIIGLAMIVTAVILRGGKLKPNRSREFTGSRVEESDVADANRLRAP